jgi:hypothetical protein
MLSSIAVPKVRRIRPSSDSSISPRNSRVRIALRVLARSPPAIAFTTRTGRPSSTGLAYFQRTWRTRSWVETAVGLMMLRGQVNAENFGESLDEAIQEVQENRRERLNFQTTGALIIECSEEIEATLEGPPNRDFGEFAVYWDVIHIDEVMKSFRDRAAALVSSLFISSSGQYVFERVTDGVYLVKGDEKVVYSFTSEVGEGTIYTFNLVTLKLKPEYASMLEGNTDMRSVCTLLTQSLDVSTDRFRTFLFAYTALEILINKALSRYEQNLVDELASKILRQ